MRRILADALRWVTLAQRKDQWHARAVPVSQQLGTVALVTTDEVLTEFRNHLSGFGESMRVQAAGTVRAFLDDPTLTGLPQSRQTFLAGLDPYEARQDKGYGLTDCISMAVMRLEGIVEVLTLDDPFAQEGFVCLF